MKSLLLFYSAKDWFPRVQLLTRNLGGESLSIKNLTNVRYQDQVLEVKSSHGLSRDLFSNQPDWAVSHPPFPSPDPFFWSRKNLNKGLDISERPFIIELRGVRDAKAKRI
jgi:hypothetical protein